MQEIRAISKYVRVSPYKLRPYAEVIRGYCVDKAYSWLKTCSVKRVNPLIKTLVSAYSNGKNVQNDITSMSDLIIKEVRVDQGPIVKYFKPSAMGRASIQRKRLCHIKIILDRKENKKIN